MNTKIKSQTNETLAIEVTVSLVGSMLEAGVVIDKVLNEARSVATGEGLKRFDTDGGSIQAGSIKVASKGLVENSYQTPYGDTRVKRHVWLSSKGGATFRPLERDVNDSRCNPEVGEDAVAQIFQTECR